MKEILSQLDRAFENRVRLGVMAALAANERLEYTHLRELLGVTDGNLASHLRSLEKSGYVSFEKSFRGRRPSTSYATTEAGRVAFRRHLDALDKLIN